MQLSKFIKRAVFELFVLVLINKYIENETEWN